MYFLVTLITLLKTFTPYFRKHILDSLEGHEYLFLNTVFVTLFVLFYFIYKFIYHDDMCDKLVNKIYNLTFLQVIFFILIAFITLVSSIVLINLDKNYNTPLINSILTKGIAAILLLFVGTIIYEEKYNSKQIFGIFLTIIGLFLINCKK
uniref:EamA domain-containing protein n=1 Tax=viral metagenome TaxID=1070528 RepID=A0A6C0IH95_9ZZZZ